MIIFSFIKNLLRRHRRNRFYQRYARQFRSYMKKQGISNTPVNGERDYLKKWNVFGDSVEPYSYRFFSHYCGQTPNIVPEDIGHVCIETVLNPIRFRSVYEDKNMFPEIVGRQHVPQTIVCRINGSQLLDAKYKIAEHQLEYYMSGFQKLVLKPSVDSCSGSNVMIFERRDNLFTDVAGGVVLNRQFLLEYGKDFVLQEGIEQHETMIHLCSTSVNTIRICVYRSPIDERPRALASIVRIGKNGSHVDNAHSGGMFIGCNIDNGQLGNCVYDQYGNRSNKWNDIDFSVQSITIPNWDEIIKFAEFIGSKVYHHRLLALDIAIRHDGKPVMLEYNISQFSYWLFMLTNQEVFGIYTDEVIDYCLKHPAIKPF